MPDREWFRIKKRTAPPNSITDERNFHACQGAIFRGEVDLVLENIDQIDRDWFDQFRRNHNTRQGHNRPFEVQYPDHSFTKTHKTVERPDVEDRFERVEWEGFKLKYVKLLAAGGFGAATLWNAEFEDGTIEKFVMKLAVHDKFSAAGEVAWHRRYAGNEHVVQPKELHEVGQKRRREARNKSDGSPPPKFTGKRFDMKDLNVLALEFVENGDLFDLLATASKRKIQFSTKVLWEFWECRKFTSLLAGNHTLTYHRSCHRSCYRRISAGLFSGGQESIFRGSLGGCKEIGQFQHICGKLGQDGAQP